MTSEEAFDTTPVDLREELIQLARFAASALAKEREPEFMTISELASWLRLDESEVKDPERWIKNRLMPSHVERLPHHRFTRNQPVFSREDRAEISERYRHRAASAGPPNFSDLQTSTQDVGFDPKAIARGARILGFDAKR